MICQQPSPRNVLHWCGQRSYGLISPGKDWSEACFHHFHVAARKGWLVKR